MEQNVGQDKVANSLWIGDELSPQHVISINSFIQNGFKYNLYTYDGVKNIPSGVNVLDGNVILPESKKDLALRRFILFLLLNDILSKLFI